MNRYDKETDLFSPVKITSLNDNTFPLNDIKTDECC